MLKNNKAKLNQRLQGKLEQRGKRKRKKENEKRERKRKKGKKEKARGFRNSIGSKELKSVLLIPIQENYGF